MPEQRNKKILDEVKKVTYNTDVVDILNKLDRDLVKGALSGEHFLEYFDANAKDERIKAAVHEILA